VFRTKDVNRAATAFRAVLENFAAYQPHRVPFESVKPCPRRVDVHPVMIFAKRRDFSEVIVLDDNSCFSYLS